MTDLRLSLIWQYNAYVDQPKGTIWLVKGDFDPSSHLSEGPDSKRVVGPIEFQLSGEIHERFAETLRWLGCEVSVHDIADD